MAELMEDMLVGVAWQHGTDDVQKDGGKFDWWVESVVFVVVMMSGFFIYIIVEIPLIHAISYISHHIRYLMVHVMVQQMVHSTIMYLSRRFPFFPLLSRIIRHIHYHNILH